MTIRVPKARALEEFREAVRALPQGGGKNRSVERGIALLEQRRADPKQPLSFAEERAVRAFMALGPQNAGMREIYAKGAAHAPAVTPFRGPSKTMEQFLTWESQHNVGDAGYGPFESPLMPIPHLEFPLDHPNLYRVSSYRDWVHGAERGPHGMVVDFADYLPKDIRDLLIFEKPGPDGKPQRYVRWPLSPFDRRYHHDMVQYLNDRGVPVEERSDVFVGRTTVSKSIIVVDQQTGRSFSTKTSTDGTVYGHTASQDRPFPARWAHLSRRLSDYYRALEPKFQSLAIDYDGAMAALPPVKTSEGHMVDAAFTVRLMESVSRGDTHEMSGFVLGSPREVARLAKKNGMTSDEFITRIAEIMGRALIELNLIAGFSFGSAHLQNIRFEFDRDLKLTGRMVLVDLSDGQPVAPIMKRNGAGQLLDDWQALVADSNPVQTDALRQPSTGWFRYFKGSAKKALVRAMRERLREITGGSAAWAKQAVNDDGILSLSLHDPELKAALSGPGVSTTGS